MGWRPDHPGSCSRDTVPLTFCSTLVQVLPASGSVTTLCIGAFTLPCIASSKGLVDLMVDKEAIMRMFDVQAIEIAAPRHEVFEFLAQPGNLPLCTFLRMITCRC